MVRRSRHRPVLIAVGTRPEAIKLAPVIEALKRRDELRPIVVATSQHSDMLRQALQTFDVAPDIDLDVMVSNQTSTRVAREVLKRLEPVLEEHNPCWTIVQGDTTSAFAAATASFYGGVRVAHVEAGLRTGRFDCPFPEEFNRRAIAVATRLHFAPTPRAVGNLLAEGVSESDIMMVGNTVVDAVLSVRSGQPPPRVTEDDRRLVLVTLHRRESLDGPLHRMAEAVRSLAYECRGRIRIVFPVHRNPSVDRPIRRILGDVPDVELREPMAYPEFLALFASARCAITDSGGLQEEAPALGVPVLVAREATERPEAVESGWARLIGTDPKNIIREARALLDDDERHTMMTSGPNPFGDGHAGDRIAAALAERTKLS